MTNSKTLSTAAAASGSRRPAANLHQVKKRDETKQSSRPRRVLKSHLCWYVPYNPDVSRDKVSGVRHIKWKCPPSFGVDPSWLVACGEESHEAKHQNNREKSVDEALYPCLTAIPPSPLTAPGEEYNDSEILVVPLIPIEDLVEADTKIEAAMVALEDIPIEDLVEVDTKAEVAPEAATAALEDIDKLSAPGEEYNDVETPPVIPLIPIEDLVEVDTKAEAATAALEDIDKELIKILCNQEKMKKPKGDGVPPPPPPPSINRARSHHHHHNHHQLGGMQRHVRAPTITPSSCSRPRPMTMSVPNPPDIDTNRLIDDYGRRQQYHASTIMIPPPPPPNVEHFINRNIPPMEMQMLPPMQMWRPQYPAMLPPTSPMMQQIPPHERFGPQHHHNYIPPLRLGLGLRSASAHDLINHPASSVVSSKPNCVYYATSRGCRNGSKCRFKHQRER